MRHPLGIRCSSADDAKSALSAQVGFGPIAWLIISEVFPLNCRTRALSAAVTVNFGFNLLMTFTLKPLQAKAQSPAHGG